MGNQFTVSSLLSTLPEDIIMIIINKIDGTTIKYSLFVSKDINLYIQKYLNRYPTNKKINYTSLVKKGHLSLLIYAKNIFNFEMNVNLVNAATFGGHTNILEWIINDDQKNKDFFDYAYEFAALSGHINVLEWLYNNHEFFNRKLWNFHISVNAAESGHFEVLKWLKEHKYMFSVLTMYHAARRGDFEIVKWLRENECNWNELTCSGATAGGHIDILKWAIENGCDYDLDNCKNIANINSDDKIITYLKILGGNESLDD